MQIMETFACMIFSPEFISWQSAAEFFGQSSKNVRSTDTHNLDKLEWERGIHRLSGGMNDSFECEIRNIPLDDANDLRFNQRLVFCCSISPLLSRSRNADAIAKSGR